MVALPEQVISSQTIPAGTIVTAASYFFDRIRPDCEILAVPAKDLRPGHVEWQFGSIAAAPERTGTGLRKLVNSNGRPVSVPEDRWIIDLRTNSPANWAHFLNNHLPIVFGLADAAGLDHTRAVAILPGDIPDYIVTVAHEFGLDTLKSDAEVHGQGLSYALAPWQALRAARFGWSRLPTMQAALAALLKRSDGPPLPKKVFLKREKTRTLMNFDEIESLLVARGFETLLPETLPPADQIRLFREADEIVAIHGAGLAPLLYCAPGAGPRRLIEILPCGHMTDVYRVIAHQVGTRWIGVRGRLKPEYVRPAYRLDKDFIKYSLDPFEADPMSLDRAFEMSDAEERVQ
ncbi:MAG: glycosyltransferase family 61 protein [Rhodobacter sp.]|nr:glycosyltransferase family 61 protein [Rhodobacter sp.]